MQALIPRRTSGMTLIELMIVVIIIGILTAISYPQYLKYVLRAKRHDATATLLLKQTCLEKCFSEKNSYVNCNCLNGTSEDSPEGHYTITFPTLNATDYTLRALPQGPQTKDTDCGTFEINDRGQKVGKKSNGATNDKCWN